MRLTHLFNEGSNWHTDPEQQSMDATRRARLGREREPAGSDAIDARLAANNNARQQYAETGRFWLKQKDTQQHLNDQPYTGKAAANVAALELLKQQPELRGNLVITAYGPGEQQVTEGKVKELGQDLKDKAMSDDDFKKKYSKTRAEVRAAMREKQVVAEAPGAETLGHNQSTVASNLNSLDLGEGSDQQVGFSLDSERAYQAVMSRFGDMIDQDQDSGTMYAPERLWPKIEQVAYDADGIGAQRDDDLENPEHYSVDENWKQKLGAAALAGSLALGAAGANARTSVPGADSGLYGASSKPVATQQATDTFSAKAQYDIDTGILTYKGKQYKWDTKSQATGQGEVVSAPSMAVGSRSMGPTKVELNPNGTYTRAGVNEGEKVGNMDADRFDDAVARLKKLAGAGPMRTVYDPAKRVYKNVPTAQQPGTNK